MIHLNEQFHRHSGSICRKSWGKYEKMGFLSNFAMLLFMVLSPNYHDFPFSSDIIIYQHYLGKKNISRFSILLDCQSIMSFRCAVPMYAMSRVGSLLHFGCLRFSINQLMVIYTSLLHSKNIPKRWIHTPKN